MGVDAYFFPKWPTLAVIVALSAVVTESYASAGVFSELLTVSPPIVLDTSGSRLNEYPNGAHLLVRTITQNPTDGGVGYSMIIEVRKMPDNLTLFLSIQPASINPNGERLVDVSWVADESAEYQVRIFAISNLTNPQILSYVKTSELTIYDSNQFEGMIRMIRGPCDGTCPHYVIEVYENGTAVFDGRDYVAVPGRHAFNISQSQIDGLVNEFYEADFFSLEDRYGSFSDGAPSTELSANIDGMKKTVIDDTGDEVPKELLELENRIDEILDTQRWL